MIHRDELKYTDDVIATLLSDSPVWYIANALDIDVNDVQHHYNEVVGIKHNGRVLPLRYAVERSSIDSRTKSPSLHYKSTQTFPRDPQYWAERTATEIANELGMKVQYVKNYAWRWGFKTKRAIMGIRDRTDWPTNPEWYAIRTLTEAATELNLRKTTVLVHVRKHTFKLRRHDRFVDWPNERAWFEARTTVQIANELRANIDAVHQHCRVRQYKTIPCRIRPQWPVDASWYAERTRQQVADQLNTSYRTVCQHIWRHGIQCKRDSKATR